MFRVTKEIHFCYGHRLLGYEGKCRNLHGHNGIAVITIGAPSLDRLGMVVDFTDIKRTLGRWIDETLDHKMLLHREDPVVDYLRSLGEPLVLLNVNPTAENIARLICHHAEQCRLPVVEVKLWETENSFATYVPSAGASMGDSVLEMTIVPERQPRSVQAVGGDGVGCRSARPGEGKA